MDQSVRSLHQEGIFNQGLSSNCIYVIMLHISKPMNTNLFVIYLCMLLIRYC